MRNKTIQVLCGFIVLFYSLLSGCATSTDQYQADSMEPKSAAIDVEMGNGDAMAAHRRAMLAEKGSKPGGMMNGGTGMAAGPCAMMTDGAGTAAGPCPILTNEDGTAGGMMVGGTGMAAGNCAMMPGENSMHPRDDATAYGRDARQDGGDQGCNIRR